MRNKNKVRLLILFLTGTTCMLTYKCSYLQADNEQEIEGADLFSEVEELQARVQRLEKEKEIVSLYSKEIELLKNMVKRQGAQISKMMGEKPLME